MRKELYTVLCLTMVGCMLTGCVEEYEADISAENSGLLVVEGTIRSAQLNTFSLSVTNALKAPDVSQMVTGAKVAVRGTDGSEYLTQESDGYYTCQIERLSPDVEYYLHIEADGEVYESDPQLPLRTEKIAYVKGVQGTPGSNIDVLVTPAEPFETDHANYYSWTYDETWQVEPEYKTAMYFDTEKQMPVYKDIYNFPKRGWVDATGPIIYVGASTGYDDQHISDLKIYDIDRGDVRMYYRYSGLVHQRAISKAEYEYELARRKASTEMGGLFTPLPSALPTNIHCLTSAKHVIGFVGCSLNTSDYRFFLNGEEYDIKRPSKADTRVWLDDPTMEECCKMVEKGMYLCEWVIPEMSDDGKLHTIWAFLHQLDVRYGYEGAYIEEPDFWSLNENVSY
ncbi:MAG: DUF4249 domain-containing protein [Prevotella sp.]|nr:DUF4249 domain-containing protein [Prevotella sp.]